MYHAEARSALLSMIEPPGLEWSEERPSGTLVSVAQAAAVLVPVIVIALVLAAATYYRILTW